MSDADPQLTPISPYPDPVFSAEDAFKRAQENLSGHELTSAVARLISYGTFESWADISDDRSDTTPVWLVGFLAPDLTLDNVMPYSGSDEPIVGGFSTWDATSGDLMAQGRLDETGSRTYVSIVSLPNESISIRTATDMPVFEPGTAEPTPTYSVSDMATAYEVLTQTAAATATSTTTPPIP